MSSFWSETEEKKFVIYVPLRRYSPGKWLVTADNMA